MLDWIPVIGPAVKKITSRVTDKILPDKVSKAEKLRHELELEVIERQARLAEAQSPSVVTSGWRPGFMWLVLFVVFYNHGFYEFVTMWQNGAFHKIVLPAEVWDLLAVIGGAYGVGRTFEKVGQVNRKAEILQKHLDHGGVRIEVPVRKTPVNYTCTCGHKWTPTPGSGKEPCEKCGVWFEG